MMKIEELYRLFTQSEGVTTDSRGRLTGEHIGGEVNISCEDHGYIMVLAMITPRIGYHQGNTWDVNLKTYEDLHKPEFDQIGFQNLPTDQMAYWDTRLDEEGNPMFRSAGKQPSWIHYQTNFNKNFGNFAVDTAEAWMVLNRNYSVDEDTHQIQDRLS